MDYLPLGKLSPDLLEKLLRKIPILDKNVLIGPGTGLDCSVIDFGDQYLVLKSDPISLASDNIGWYAVEINVNDIVTTGADPKWMLTTLLLPEKATSKENLEIITDQLIESTNKYGITIIGGHTEITSGIDRPILSSTMIGTVKKENLITPKGVKSGDKIFLTKEIAIETVSILANDFEEELQELLSPEELYRAQSYIHNPGISIYKEATLLRNDCGITGMHDPTEGGLAAALWEMSIASDKIFYVNVKKIPISNLTEKICSHFSINPISSISSGALLFTAQPHYTEKILSIFHENSIQVTEIGYVEVEGKGVFINKENGFEELIRPERDEITKVF
jgi:hydrogenase maturation factor